MPTKSTFVQVRTPGRRRTASDLLGVTTSSSDWVQQWTDTRTDDGPIRGYRQRIARGQDATTNLTGSRRLYKCRPGYYMVRFERKPGISPQQPAWVEQEEYGDLTQITMPFIGSPNLQEADNAARMEFTSKARSAVTALEGGVVLGEIGETLRMLRSPAKALRTGVNDFFTAISKRRRGPPRTRRQVLADTWLEYSFGWTPLINDIKDASYALERIKLRLNERKFVKAVATRRYDGTHLFGTDTMEGAHQIYARSHEYSEAIVVYRGSVILPIGDRSLMTRQNLGFTWSNFVPTLWELVPYSFLVDYFTNIGDVLSAWAMWDVNFGWKNRTTIVRRVREMQTLGFTGQFNYNPDWYNITERQAMPTISETETRDVSRSPYTGSLIPDFRFEIPGMRSLKWLNIAALATSKNRLTPF